LHAVSKLDPKKIEYIIGKYKIPEKYIPLTANIFESGPMPTP
jgi:hypothetical protein